MTIKPNSSTIDSITYEIGEQMLVKFKSGGSYVFLNVPQDVAAQFMQQPEGGSHGKHFHKHIKGKYPSSKITIDDQSNEKGGTEDAAAIY